MTKNMKALMAGTTTLLLGMNVFATPVQAAVGASNSAVDDECRNALNNGQQTTGTSGKGSTGKPDDQTVANAESTNPKTDNGTVDKDGEQNSIEKETPTTPATDSQKDNTGNQDETKDDSTSKSNDHKSTDNSQSDKKEETTKSEVDTTKSKEEPKKLERINVKDLYNEDGSVNKEKLANYLNGIGQNNSLGIANIFHIFSEEIDQRNDLAGNIATDKFIGNQFGSPDSSNGIDSDMDSNLTAGDIHYVGGLGNINDVMGQFKTDSTPKIIILGPNMKISKPQNAGSIKLTDSNSNKSLELSNVGTQKNCIITLKELQEAGLNFGFKNQQTFIQQTLTQLGEKFDRIAKDHNEENKIDFSNVDQNDRAINIKDLKPNIDGNIYINIDAAYLDHPITIKNIREDGPGIIINVNTKAGTKQLVVNSQIKLQYSYDDKSKNITIGNAEKHTQSNKLLWNFGSNLDTLTFGNTLMGSVLATGATININQNVDGNIIGKVVNINCESHRWDDIPPVPINPTYPVIPDGHKSDIPDDGWSYDLPKLNYGKPDDGLSYDLPKLNYGKPDDGLSYDLPKLNYGKPDDGLSYDLPKLNYGKPDDGLSYDLPKLNYGKPDDGLSYDLPKLNYGKPDDGLSYDLPKLNYGKPDDGLSYDLPKLNYGKPDDGLSYDLPKLNYGKPDDGLSYDLPKLDITNPVKPTNPGKDTPKPKDEIPPFPFNPAYPAIPDHNVPDNPTTPDFFKPQPKAPIPDQPVTPSFSEPKSKTPLPDAGTHSISTPNDDVETFFKAQAKAKLVSKKVSVRGKVESAKPVTATPKTMVEHANVGGKVATPQAKKLSSLKSAPQTKKAASLPQTGQKQNHIALLGLGLVLSAAALAIGFFDKTKKN